MSEKKFQNDFLPVKFQIKGQKYTIWGTNSVRKVYWDNPNIFGFAMP